MLLMIDNYDSFTFNLVQYFGELAQKVNVFRNDEISINQIEALKPQAIIISPGPCTPREAGISNEVIKHFSGRIPILGVCLGHQCIGFVNGATIARAKRIMHGKTSAVYHHNLGMFKNLPNPVQVARYHSLIVSDLPPGFELTAWAEEDGEKIIMAMRHRHLPIESVQFHPESFLTEQGQQMLANFLQEYKVSL